MKLFLSCIMLFTLISACHRLINKGTDTSSKTPPPVIAGATTPLIKEAGIKRYYLNINGDNRTFLVQLPKDYSPAKTYPVVFFFHAIRGKDTSWIKNRGINNYIDKYNYIGVYGQGANGGIWNIGGGHYPFKDISEPDFVTGMYNWLKQNTKIDTKHVYAIGASNGALLAHYLAIETNIFSGIVTISGSLYTGEMKDKAQPTAVLQIHGELDKTVPYNGGPTPYEYTFLSARNSVKTWAGVNGCDSEPQVTNLLNGKVIEYSYANCKKSKPAILYSIPNAPHKVLQNFDATWVYDRIFEFLAKN